MLLTVHSVPVLVFATCLITAGLYPSVILLTTWLGVNTAGFTKRGTTWAMAEIFGQCFSIMGTHVGFSSHLQTACFQTFPIFLQLAIVQANDDSQVYDGPPRFVKGHAIVLSFLLFGIVCATTLICLMRYLNKHKEAALQRYSSQGEPHPHREKSLEEAGDHHLNFRYIL